MSGVEHLANSLDMYFLEQVPPGSTMVARYVEFKYGDNSNPPRIKGTVYYRTENGTGNKRRVDLEWTLTGIGDVGAVEAVQMTIP